MSVRLPVQLSTGTSIEDKRSHVGITVALEGASGASAEVVGSAVVYRDERRVTVLHPARTGIEDLTLIEEPHIEPAISYRVALDHGIGGVRFVANTLEILDRQGIPRIRMAPPYVIDRRGHVFAARVEVSGCAFSSDTAPPWQRSPLPPSAPACHVRIDWAEHPVVYPAVLDPSWTTTTNMIEPRANHTMTALVGNRVLVAGGDGQFSSVVLKSAEVYDVDSGTWAATGAMQATRARHVATALASGKVFVTGGRTGSSLTSASAWAELYDPAAGTWSVAAALGVERYDHTATLLADGRVLVVGGISATKYLDSAELYAPSANTWTWAAPLSVTRYQHAAQRLNDGRVLIAGGEALGGTYLASCELFAPATGQWSPTGNLNVPRRALTATLLGDGRVLAVGGYPNPSAVDIYAPSTGAWAKTTDIPSARYGHTATLLNGGGVLVAGGAVKGEPTGSSATALLYETWTSAWAPLGPMAYGRAFHTATKLADERVLVAGGVPSGGNATATGEIFTPGAGPDGATCAAAVECVSGHCIDGVCCNYACDGICEACTTAAKGFGDNGLCGPIAAGTDPDDECPVDPGFPASCLADGMCDGKGKCRTVAAAGVVCGASVCTGGWLSTPQCDGSGACKPFSAPCDPYACKDAATCTTSCVTSSDCSPAAYCKAGACDFTWGNGWPCTSAEPCASGNCVDGVCCNHACTGQCEACNIPGNVGNCIPVFGAPVSPRPSCGGTAGTLCAGTCDGITTNSCAYASSGADCGTSCQNDVELPKTCSPTGECVAGPPAACAPYRCSNAGKCADTCTSDGDCSAGYRCSGGACVSTAAFCADDHTIVLGGKSFDCAPYRCESGACVEACTTDDDCLSPAVCTDEQRCEGPSSEDSKGCGCAAAGNRTTADTLATWLVIGLGLLGVYRRKARAVIGPGKA